MQVERTAPCITVTSSLQAIVPTPEEAAHIAKKFETKQLESFEDSGITVENVHYDFEGADYKNYKTLLGTKEGVGSITLQSSKTGVLPDVRVHPRCKNGSCEITQ